jgi:hypothetical protein
LDEFLARGVRAQGIENFDEIVRAVARGKDNGNLAFADGGSKIAHNS